MRLIIIAEESVYEHEVDPSMEVQDVLALIEAESGNPAATIQLTTDSGTRLESGSKTLESYGLTGESSTIFMSAPPQATSSSSGFGSSSAARHGSGFGNPQASADAEMERMRLQILGNPSVMSQLRQSDPQMAAAVSAGTQRFAQALAAQRTRMQGAAAEKERQIEALNDDPYDIEAQKKIEEAIRMERVNENMEHAMEFSPESFGHVTMLYINVEVNGHPLKAFVDSGAQRTIISPDCAERCGIMRLLDPRFQSIAVGVGTAQILGRIHSAQIKLGNLHLPCSFTVLEGKGVDLLFGLDMLKRYQCSIDLAKNALVIQSNEIPFLAEHELPNDLQQIAHAEAAAAAAASEGVSQTPSAGAQGGASSRSAGPSFGAGPSGSGGSGSTFPGPGNAVGGPGPAPARGGPAPRAPESASDAAREGKVKEEDVQTLMGLGAERNQAIQLLEASGGNVDYAASMLFGGGAQWP